MDRSAAEVVDGECRGGTDFDRLIVWDAKTFEQVLTIKEERFVRSAPILAQLSLSAVRAA